MRHPLLETGLGKRDVRELARALGVPSAEKPASPCLASRLPYGTPVDAGTLAQVDRAERGLKELGYRELRVRHFGSTGRVELAEGELHRARSIADGSAIERAVLAAGYERVEISEEPLRSGSLNAIPLPIVRTS